MAEHKSVLTPAADPALGSTLPRAQTQRPLADLRWLVRYARHGRLALPSDVPVEQALRAMFGPAGWRIICRSPKERFLPILRNRDLSIHSLITYCKRLAERSFVTAPQAILLEYFVTQRRLYFSLPSRVPEGEDYDVMRIADRATGLKMADIALVTNWLAEGAFPGLPRLRWDAMVRKARTDRRQAMAEVLARQQIQWHFYCDEVKWRGLHLVPLRGSAALWFEGQAMGHCVHRIRSECHGLRPSRFFSIRKAGKRIATLELSWRPPQRGDIGMDREWGRWELKDLRLSFNRLPDQALLLALQDFAEMFNNWAKRPARLVEQEAQAIDDRLGVIHGTSRRPWRPLFTAAV